MAQGWRTQTFTRLDYRVFVIYLLGTVAVWGLVIGGAFMHLVQMATDQVSVQRYLKSKSLKETQRGLWIKQADRQAARGLYSSPSFLSRKADRTRL